MNKRTRLALSPAGVAIIMGAAIIVAAACGTASGNAAAQHSASAAKARAAVSALAQNKQAQADKTALENKILACIKTNHTATNITHCAFPKGDTKAIRTYAVQTFSVPVLSSSGPGSARDRWVQGVAVYALAQGQK